MSIKVCMMSARHYLLDGRIYNREAKTLLANGYEVLHIGYGNEDKHYFTEDGAEIIQLKKLKKGGSFKTAFQSLRQSFLADIFEAAAKAKADVYHLHDIELCRIARKLQRLPHKPKVIYDAHEPYFENFLDFRKYHSLPKTLFNDIPALLAEKSFLKKADLLIATESNVGERFARINPHTAVIHNYSYSDENLIQSVEKKYDLVYSGTINEERGIEFIVDAVYECKKRGVDVSCVIVGNFETKHHEDSVKKKIATYNLDSQFHFPGHIAFDDVFSFYNESKIGVCLLPRNRTFKITLHVKLFEYLHFGLPIIVSNFGHMKDIAETDKVGFAVDPYDASEVADKILYLLKDDRWQQYSNRCIEVVRKKYTWQEEAKKFLTLYKNMLSQEEK
ncbi:glycosyltransferase [Pinibacter aurantiacus]|uniref:Glycosyltransferase n=1 Tax=Pinibacter aurantiacus TaxID=2851599 RepID=A0A9E2S6X0_9BACT|nr:glycosyltransferase [Pinibacter aurantiacus]MBV4356906.1 glycosyltransferase [Pinibacter aurantiacus]